MEINPGMVHTDDPSTSYQAAEKLMPKLHALHECVLNAFEAEGPMTDEELEELPQFAAYGPSTIRKRRSELYQAGKVTQTGKRKNSRGQNMIVWRSVESSN